MIQRRQQVDRDGKGSAAPELAQDIVAARLMIPTDFRPLVVVVDGNRSHLDVLRDEVRSLKKRRTEGQEVCAGTGRALWEDDYGLAALQGIGKRECLIPSAPPVRAFDVDRRILVGEPVDERVAKLVLRDKRTVGRTAKDDDVEPTGVIGYHQRMTAEAAAFHGNAQAHDPTSGSEEAPGPPGTAGHQSRQDVDGAEDGEEPDQSRDPQDCPPVQAGVGGLIVRG